MSGDGLVTRRLLGLLAFTVLVATLGFLGAAPAGAQLPTVVVTVSGPGGARTANGTVGSDGRFSVDIGIDSPGTYTFTVTRPDGFPLAQGAFTVVAGQAAACPVATVAPGTASAGVTHTGFQGHPSFLTICGRFVDTGTTTTTTTSRGGGGSTTSKKSTTDGGGSDWVWWVLAGVGTCTLFGGGYLFSRSRHAPFVLGSSRPGTGRVDAPVFALGDPNDEQAYWEWVKAHPAARARARARAKAEAAEQAEEQARADAQLKAQQRSSAPDLGFAYEDHPQPPEVM